MWAVLNNSVYIVFERTLIQFEFIDQSMIYYTYTHGKKDTPICLFIIWYFELI